jgi:general secretion pathway protein A
MELGIQRLHRSLRKTASIQIWVRNEKLGTIWEEATETQDVSRFGARLRCRHLMQIGNMLVIVRRDDGRRVNARVRYSGYNPEGQRQLGIELIDNNDFWGLDWNLPESGPPLLFSMSAPVEARGASVPGPAADCNPAQPGDTAPVPASIQEAVEVVEVASVFTADDTAADIGALPVQAEAKRVQLAPSPATDGSAADISARAGQEVTEVVQIALPSVTDDNAPDPSTPAARAESESVAIAPGLAIGESTADPSAPSIEKAVEVVVIAPSVGADESATDTGARAGQAVTEVVQIAPSPVTDDSAADASAPPVQAEAEGGEIAANFDIDEGTADTRAPLVQIPVRVVVIASSLATVDSSADTSVPPARVEPEGVEITPNLILDESTAGCGASPVQDAVEQQIPQSFRVAGRHEEPVAPSFLDFYGLGEQPFDVTSDPAYLYPSQTHRDALTSLVQGIQNLRGFMALIAQPGLGKTTLLNKLIEELGDSARIVFLFQTQCDSRELLRYLLAELGIEETGKDAVTMHKALNEILFREMLEGRRFVLIVDEAQNLHDSVLETIRLLSDFETTHTKLIQIVLSGQPQLADTLRRPHLSQLRQRIAVLANLKPLSTAETGQYIDHRLRTAGLNGKPIFTPEALTLIGERSRGIPRIINNLCFNALLLGYSEGRNPIASEIVQKAVAKSDWASLVRYPSGIRPALSICRSAQTRLPD